MNMTTDRRLPAHGRAIRDNLNAGRVPVLGGNCVAVCIGWPAQCVLAHVVCLPDERPPDGWDFGFLAGVESIVWFDYRDRTYAEEVRRELITAGSPIVAMLQLPEDEQ